MAELVPLFYHDVEFEEFPELRIISARKRFSSDEDLYAKVLQMNFQNKIDAQVEVDNAALDEAIAEDIEEEAQMQLHPYDRAIVYSDSDDSDQQESDDSDNDMEIDDSDHSDEEVATGDDDNSMDYNPSVESEEEADHDE